MSVIAVVTISTVLGYLYYNSDEYIFNKYNDQIEHNPKDYKAHLKLADRYRDKKEYHSATKHYKEVLKYDKSNLVALQGLCDCSYNIGEYQQSAEYCTMAVKQDPYHYDSNFILCKALMKAGELDKALAGYKGLLEKYPDSDELLVAVGSLYEDFKQPDEAIKLFDKAKKINKRSHQARSGLARIYLNQNQFDLSLVNAKEAILIDKTCYNYYILGYAYESIGNPDSAIDNYNRVVECKPDERYDVYNRLGYVYMTKKKYKDSEYHFKSALDINSIDNKAFLGLIKLYIESKQEIESEQIINKYLALNHCDAEALHKVGSVYMNADKLTLAMNYFNLALKLNKTNADLYNDLGTVYYRQKNYLKAMENYRKAREIDGQNAIVIYNIARTYLKLGKKDEAQKVYKELKKLDQTWAKKYEKETKQLSH